MGFKVAFHQANIPCLTNVFVKLIVFPLILVFMVAFLASKVTKLVL